MNGEEDEAVKMVQEMKERIETEGPTSPASVVEESVKAEDSGSSGEVVEAEEDESADIGDSVEKTDNVKPKRGRPSKKKA